MSIADKVQEHTRLQEQGAGVPIAQSPEPIYAAQPLARGIPGPVRGSYQPDQILSSDFDNANTTAGLPVRSKLFLIPANPSTSALAKNSALSRIKTTISSVTPQTSAQPTESNAGSNPAPNPTPNPSPVAIPPVSNPVGGPQPITRAPIALTPGRQTLMLLSGPQPINPRIPVGISTPSAASPIATSPKPINPRLPIDVGRIGSVTGFSVNPTANVRNINTDNITDGATFKRVLSSALTANQVDPTKSGVLMKGSVPPMYSGVFTYTSTTSAALVKWSNLILYRADGTITNIGSGSQNITGLSAGITYLLLPYYSEANSTLNWVQASNLTQSYPSIQGVQFTENASGGKVTTAGSVSPSSTQSWGAWFHVSAQTANTAHNLAVFSASPNFTLTVNDQSGVVEASFTNSSNTLVDVASTQAYNDGEWHFAVATMSGTTLTLYVDGTEIGTASGTPKASASGTWGMADVGALNTTAVYTLAYGLVFNGTAVTSQQVSDFYNLMMQSGETAFANAILGAGATYFWELQETSGTTATDSADSNNGTYAGTYTLNESQAAIAPQGSPAIAWPGLILPAIQAQVLQGNVPLGTVSITIATTGTGGGYGGGAKGSGGGGAIPL